MQLLHICVTLLSRQLEYQNRLILLEKSVDVFRQCKQLLDNKRLQLVSIIENNLINKLNTIYKRVVSKKSIYTKKILLVCYICYQIYRTLLALFAVKYIEFCLLCLLSSISSLSTSVSSNTCLLVYRAMQIIILYTTDYSVEYISAVTS